MRVPSEPNLFYVLQALRDRLDARALSGLWWIDTRDMVCDAMTKGSLSREPLLALWRTSMLRIIGETPIVWRSTTQRQPRTTAITTTTTEQRLRQTQEQPQQTTQPQSQPLRSILKPISRT